METSKAFIENEETIRAEAQPMFNRVTPNQNDIFPISRFNPTKLSTQKGEMNSNSDSILTPRLGNSLAPKSKDSSSNKFEYFNNFNQVPKSVLNQIRPLTLGMSSSQPDNINSIKSQDFTSEPDMFLEAQKNEDNIFLSINSGNRLTVPGKVKGKFGGQVVDFKKQNSDFARAQHEQISDINKNIFNSIVGNIEEKRKPRSSFVTYFV